MENLNLLTGDPLGFEKFLIEESFEDVFNTLKARYYQLYLKSADIPELKEKALEYKKRSNEIHRLKRTYDSKAWEEKKKATIEYTDELNHLLSEG